MILTESIGTVEEHVLSTWQREKQKRNQACQTTPVEKKFEAIQASWPVQNVPTQTGGTAPTFVDGLSLQRLASRAEAALIENGGSEVDILLVPQSFHGLDDGNVDLLFTLQPVGDDWNKLASARDHE